MSPIDAVDPSPGRPKGWTAADITFEEFIKGLTESKARRIRLSREKRRRYSIKHLRAQAYDDETEQLRRVIAVERARWMAEQERQAA